MESKVEKWTKLSNQKRGEMIRQFRVQLDKHEKGITPIPGKGAERISAHIRKLVHMNMLSKFEKLDKGWEEREGYWNSFVS